MAMSSSDTGSSFAQWADGLYDPAEPESNVVIVATRSPTSAGSGGCPTSTKTAAVQRTGVEGPRVGKPSSAARRRSRASRRAPVTLLNTDTANFRAMVQQFTGVPTPPAAGAFGTPLINFAGDYGFPPPAGVVSFDDHLHRNQHHHPPAAALHDRFRMQQHNHHHQQQQYNEASSSFGYSSLLQGAGTGDCFFASAEDRMLLQSMHAAQMPAASAANNTSPLGFFA